MSKMVSLPNIRFSLNNILLYYTVITAGIMINDLLINNFICRNVYSHFPSSMCLIKVAGSNVNPWLFMILGVACPKVPVSSNLRPSARLFPSKEYEAIRFYETQNIRQAAFPFGGFHFSHTTQPPTKKKNLHTNISLFSSIFWLKLYKQMKIMLSWWNFIAKHWAFLASKSKLIGMILGFWMFD